MNFVSSNSQATIENLYNDIAKLRSSSFPQAATYRTVFNDISDEWGSCSEDERTFIEGNEDYQKANLTYQQQFNAFLLDMMGTQFINSQYGKSAEGVLIALKEAKAKYKKEAADSVASVKAENVKLQNQIEELKRMIYGGEKNE